MSTSPSLQIVQTLAKARSYQAILQATSTGPVSLVGKHTTTIILTFVHHRGQILTFIDDHENLSGRPQAVQLMDNGHTECSRPAPGTAWQCGSATFRGDDLLTQMNQPLNRVTTSRSGRTIATWMRLRNKLVQHLWSVGYEITGYTALTIEPGQTVPAAVTATLWFAQHTGQPVQETLRTQAFVGKAIVVQRTSVVWSKWNVPLLTVPTSPISQ